MISWKLRLSKWKLACIASVSEQVQSQKKRDELLLTPKDIETIVISIKGRVETRYALYPKIWLTDYQHRKWCPGMLVLAFLFADFSRYVKINSFGIINVLQLEQ